MNLGNYATGTQGLLYETLFLYNPIKQLVHAVACEERYVD